ncbi:MAG: alpha/beta fold hydrolase [Dehalococcoidia bacterium]
MFADDVAWISREARVTRPAIVGHSLGGVVALTVAARHPDLPAAVVALDAPILPPAAVQASRAALIARLQTDDYQAAARAFAESMFLPTDDPERRARIVGRMSATLPHVMASALAGVFAADHAAMVGATVPCSTSAPRSLAPTSHACASCAQRW